MKTIKITDLILNGRRLLSCYLFTFLEILASQMNVFDSLLTTWRKPVFFSEIQMLDIKSTNKVLHLGCGAFPSASIFIAQEKHAQVVGLDNNRIAVNLAQSCIKKKHLNDIVTIAYGDGVRYPVSDFDVIFIAINVWPIDGVLVHLAHSMKPTARILCKGSHDDITTLLKKKEFQHLFSVQSIVKRPKTQSFLLTKKK